MSRLIALIIVLGLIALITIVPNTFRAFYIVLGLLILIRLSLKTSRQRISLTTDLSGSSGFAESKLMLRLKLVNPSRIPLFWCQITESFSEPLGAKYSQALVNLPPRGETIVKMDFYPRRRGIFSVPTTRLTFGDPFGFKEQSLYFESSQKIIVYPAIAPVIGLQLTRHLPSGQKRVSFGLHEDPSRLRGCRDYSPGDNVKKIHWPNLARTGMLKVKEWETTLAAEIGVFLNLTEADFSVSEWFWLSELGIDFSASLIHELVESRETLGFYSNGKSSDVLSERIFELPPKRGYQQEKKVLEYLAGVNLNQENNFMVLFQKAYRFMGGSCLIFITPQITTAMIQRAAQLRHVGYHPVFIYLKSKDSMLSLAQLKSTKVPCLTVEKRRDTHGFLITQTQ